jgi:hypothetical protein
MVYSTCSACGTDFSMLSSSLGVVALTISGELCAMMDGFENENSS